MPYPASPTKIPAGLLIIPPEDGPRPSAFGSTATVKLTGAQSAGTFAVLFAETPPGAGPPLHVHARDDELFVVLEGTISFFGPSGGWTATQSGTVVYAPRGVAHTFRNTGSTPSRHLVVTSPSGFEEFYTRAAAVFASGSADAPAVLGGLAAEYGYTILGPAPGDG